MALLLVVDGVAIIEEPQTGLASSLPYSRVVVESPTLLAALNVGQAAAEGVGGRDQGVVTLLAALVVDSGRVGGGLVGGVSHND